jgi:uncharacterized repeat protein (TIGR02543 family)
MKKMLWLFWILAACTGVQAQVSMGTFNYRTVWAWDGVPDEYWDVTYTNTGSSAVTVEVWATLNDGGSPSGAGATWDDWEDTIVLQPGETSRVFTGYRLGNRPSNAPGEQPSRYYWWRLGAPPPPPPNAAPSVSWTSAPSTVSHAGGYWIAAHGHDDDGNLTEVRIWKNGVPFSSVGGGNGYDSDAGNWSADNGPQTITFTAQAFDASGAVSAVILHTVSVSPPPNAAPVIWWTSAPASAAHNASYTISAHGHDDNGNLTEVRIWKNGAPWSFVNGGNAFDRAAGGATSDGGPQTVTFTAHAVDGAGAVSATISHSVTIGAPPPVQYTLTTQASPGGSVSGGGTFNAGTNVAVSATPGATYEFVGWSGDASGLANPISVLVDRNKTVQANFALRSYALTTAASGGGSVTAGGTYPHGSTVTVTATPSSGYRFTGWSGDASGSAVSVTVTMTAQRSVTANFAAKAPQIVNFPPPADRSIPAPAFPPGGSATSGLPVTYTVVSGPATIVGGQIQVNGPGSITVRASQPGDDFYLPAADVLRTFNAVAAAVVKVVPASRVILAERLQRSPNFVLQR